MSLFDFVDIPLGFAPGGIEIGQLDPVEVLGFDVVHDVKEIAWHLVLT
jgi:hypothetical protein